MASKLMIATALALLATSAIAEESVGVVKRASGNVVIDRDGVQLTPTAGTPLLRGDRVITGADGQANVKLYQAGALSIGPDTAVAPDRYIPDSRQVKKPAPAILQGLASFLAVNRQR